MSKSKIDEIISRIKDITDNTIEDPPLSFTYHTQMLPPIEWNRKEIEKALDIKLPEDLEHFWRQVSELRLFEERNYFQWGLIIKSPQVIEDFHTSHLLRREEDFRKGDLIIGEFRGDADLLVIRCDSTEADFNSLLLVMPMDIRKHWSTIALTFAEFLERFLDSPLRKYWAKNE